MERKVQRFASRDRRLVTTCDKFEQVARGMRRFKNFSRHFKRFIGSAQIEPDVFSIDACRLGFTEKSLLADEIAETD